MSQSTNTITFNKKAAQANAAQRVTAEIQLRISELANRREDWEVNEYDRSNQSLYSLISECLGLYLDLTTGDDLKAKKEGLAIHIKSQGYVFKESSPLSLKVIRCVFGNKDRRRLSTYHTVLRVAIDEKWDVKTVAQNISERGGVLGAMETGYQRSKIQEESMHYEMLKHTGEYPIIGVNTFRNPKGDEVLEKLELARSTEDEKKSQLDRLHAFHAKHAKESPAMLARLQQAVIHNDNVFEVLMDAVRVCSLGQITNALFEVGGQYRRNM